MPRRSPCPCRPASVSSRLQRHRGGQRVHGRAVTLLSTIAGVPLRQDLAVTGSVNQKGEVQPIGGVNEKLEGYFQLCKAKGLTANTASSFLRAT